MLTPVTIIAVTILKHSCGVCNSTKEQFITILKLGGIKRFKQLLTGTFWITLRLGSLTFLYKRSMDNIWVIRVREVRISAINEQQLITYCSPLLKPEFSKRTNFLSLIQSIMNRDNTTLNIIRYFCNANSGAHFVFMLTSLPFSLSVSWTNFN